MIHWVIRYIVIRMRRTMRFVYKRAAYLLLSENVKPRYRVLLQCIVLEQSTSADIEIRIGIGKHH